tara:strand:- start:2496 stop:2951 length:456 start_codon:yes stop_codon:yes gene_type:complete
MSAQYLNQSVPNQNVNIRVNDAVVDKSVATKDLQINNFLFKKHTILTQTTSPTTSIDANYKVNLTINTQTFTTPHTNNNSTTFLITSYDCSLATDNVNVSIQRYNGTTGLPIITGRCLDANQYEITIINLHNSQDLNGTFRISAEITYLLS